MIGLKIKRTRALTVGPLPLPPRVEGHAPTVMIVVNGVGVDVTNQPLVMEKNLAISTGVTPQCQLHGHHKTRDSHPWVVPLHIGINPSMLRKV